MASLFSFYDNKHPLTTKLSRKDDRPRSSKNHSSRTPTKLLLSKDAKPASLRVSSIAAGPVALVKAMRVMNTVMMTIFNVLI